MSLQIIFKMMYWSWILTEVLVLVVTRTRRGGGQSGVTISDRGSLTVLWVTIMSSITAGTWVAATYAPARFHAGGWLAFLIVGLMALGLVIRWTAIYTLGRSFSANVAIRETQTLQRGGLFHYMRHPSYTGMVLIFIAMGLSTHNWVGLALIVLPPLAALLYRIHVEEAALTGAFGEQYVLYSQETRRLIPFVY